MKRLKTKVSLATIILLGIANAFVISNCEEVSTTSYIREPGGVFTISAELPDYLSESLLDWSLDLLGWVFPQVATGDFDEDGNLDVVLPIATPLIDEEAPPEYVMGQLLLCLGDGEGGFERFVQFREDFVLWSVATGDFNEDGHLDLVASWVEGDEGAVCLLFGDGDATFSPPVFFPVSTEVHSVNAGDVDADGHLDIVVLVSTEDDKLHAFVTLLGDGTGGFSKLVTSVTEFPIVTVSWWLATGDLNGDSYLDLAFFTGSNDPGQFPLVIAFGDREGRFAFSLEQESEIYPRSVDLGDVNGDGQLDVVLLHFFDLEGVFDLPVEEMEMVPPSDRLSVFLGDGEGHFDVPITSSLGLEGMLVKAADLDSDNDDDLVVFEPDGNVIVTLSEPGSVLMEPLVYTCAFSSHVWVWLGLTGDFNNDGNEDVLVQSLEPWLGVRFGDGRGGLGAGWFSTPLDSLVGDAKYLAFPATDFDQDGHLDLLFYGYWKAGVAYGDGTGRFPTVFMLSEELADKEVVIGDFDEDGLADVLIATHGGREGSVRLFLNQGDRVFGEASDLSIDLPGDVVHMVAGDLNEDEHLDLVVSCGGDTVLVFLGTGRGAFERGEAIDRSEERVAWTDLTLADFDEDGHLDLFVTDLLDFAGDGVLWLGDGRGHLIEGVRYPLSAIVGRPEDFNGDGYLDLVVTVEHQMRVLMGREGADFEVSDTNLAGGAVPIGDVDKDGHIDFATAWAGVLGIYLGDGQGGQRVSDAFATQGHGERVHSGSLIPGDFDGDGWLDLAVGAGHYLSVLLNRFSEVSR